MADNNTLDTDVNSCINVTVSKSNQFSSTTIFATFSMYPLCKLFDLYIMLKNKTGWSLFLYTAVRAAAAKTDKGINEKRILISWPFFN